MFAKLKGAMKERGVTQEQLAAQVFVSVQSLNAKLNGRSQFTLEEMQRIVNALNLSEPGDYFFRSSSQKCND